MWESVVFHCDVSGRCDFAPHYRTYKSVIGQCYNRDAQTKRGTDCMFMYVLYVHHDFSYKMFLGRSSLVLARRGSSYTSKKIGDFAARPKLLT